MLGPALVVAGQTAVADEPAEGPLDDPLAAQNLEEVGAARATTSTVIAATAIAYFAAQQAATQPRFEFEQ